MYGLCQWFSKRGQGHQRVYGCSKEISFTVVEITSQHYQSYNVYILDSVTWIDCVLLVANEKALNK